MIRFPNSFEGINNSLIVSLPEKMDLSYLNPETTGLELLVDKLIVSFIEMRSSISESHNIHYREMILKVPIVLKGQKYAFPLVTFVDDDFSLIRGYDLGFYKKKDNTIEISDTKFKISNEIIEAEINIERDSKYIEEIDLPELVKLPFVLYKDCIYSNGRKEKGHYTIEQSGYKVNGVSELVIKDFTIKSSFSEGIQISNGYSIPGQFTIHGILPIV